jgi:hypothetical protein
MSRKRKNQSAEIRFGPAFKAFLLCALIVSACLGYVWQKKQIDELGREMRRRETRLRDLHELNEKMKKQLAVLQSVHNLEQRVTELRLGLVMPQPSQVWRLPEPPISPPAPPAPPEDHGIALGQTQGNAAP